MSPAPIHALSATLDDHDTSKSPELSGTVALVTGAGRGIGQRLACTLAGAGVAAGLVARSDHELKHTRGLIEDFGGVAAAAQADVTDATGLETAVAVLRRQLGPFELLINNAGVLGPSVPCEKSTPTPGGTPWTSMCAARSSAPGRSSQT